MFPDTCFHRTEPITRKDFVRFAYAIRFIADDTEFNIDVMRDLGDRYGHYFYQVVLDNQLETFDQYRAFLATNRDEVLSGRPMRK